MKRVNEDVVGRPKPSGVSRDVAGSTIPLNMNDVASYRHALNDPMGTAIEDESLMADFEDFMSGEQSFVNGDLPAPDPAFRERLRRRLWRTHVMTHLREPGDTH